LRLSAQHLGDEKRVDQRARGCKCLLDWLDRSEGVESVVKPFFDIDYPAGEILAVGAEGQRDRAGA
jgi:hypothetical protein